MKTKNNLFIFSTLLGLGVSLLSALPAKAYNLTHISSDTEMNDLMGELAFVAEGRIGDRGGAATHELNLHEDDPGKPNITTQFNWENGKPQPFEIIYDALSSRLNFTVGNKTLSHTYTNPFSDVFLRTRAVNENTNILLSNLSINGETIPDQSHAISETGGLDILRISDLPDSFKLTGESTMNWEDIPPTQSTLAYQIKFSQPTPEPTPVKEVPEPSVLLGLFGFTFLGTKMRKLV